MHSINSLTFLHFMNHVIILPELSLVERRRAKDRERWSKSHLNMTNDQKAKKKNANKQSTGTINYSDFIGSVAANKNLHISWSIIFCITTYIVYFLIIYVYIYYVYVYIYYNIYGLFLIFYFLYIFLLDFFWVWVRLYILWLSFIILK